MRKLLLLILCLTCAQAIADDKPQLWLYCPINLQVDENIPKAAEIWKRAAAAGYTHVLLTDSKMAKLGDLGGMEKTYFANVEKIKKLAAELKLEIVPALFNIGYSNNMLWHDPNLAEGLPVKDQPFIVQDGQAKPTGQIDFPKKPNFHDDSVHLEGNLATAKDNRDVARLIYGFKVPQYRCYHISVQIKTDDYSAQPEIKAIGAANGNRTLQWQHLGVKRTQDWTRHDVIFNSLDNDQFSLYFGVWGSGKGTLQWKDWKIEEAGLVNVLRREGAPCTVKTEDGKTLVEGKDYEPIIDTKLGNHPWKGEYDAWHEPVTIKTKLPSGTKLLVSWHHPAIVYDGQVSACISDPKTNALLADEAQRVKAAWGAAGYMMQHDEFRTLGWDASCEHSHKTPGQLLADNARYCTQLLGSSQAYVWNDMFDPFHNAVKGPYYLVNGPWTDSWEGLDKNVVIVNWNFGKRDESLKFFADRGHKQLIAGYYDGPMSDAKSWAASAAKVQGVIGYMYTTWRGDYSQMEAYAKASGR